MAIYKIRLELDWDEAGQQYSVTSPDLPELFTYGETLAEVQHNVQEAVDLLLETLEASGQERPPALRQPMQKGMVDALILPVAA